MKDDSTTIGEVKKLMREFVKQREWERFHTPKDLAIAVAVEAAEIMEHFRFRNGEELKSYLGDSENIRELRHEMADVLSFLVRLAEVTGTDLAAALEEKIRKNHKRYPADKAKGSGWMAIKKAERRK